MTDLGSKRLLLSFYIAISIGFSSRGDYVAEFSAYEEGPLGGQDGWIWYSGETNGSNLAIITNLNFIGQSQKCLYYQIEHNKSERIGTAVYARKLGADKSSGGFEASFWVCPSSKTDSAWLGLYQDNYHADGNFLSFGTYSNGFFGWHQGNEFGKTESLPVPFEKSRWYQLTAKVHPESQTFDLLISTNQSASAVIFKKESIALNPPEKQAIRCERVTHLRLSYLTPLNDSIGILRGPCFSSIVIHSLQE